jgi:hypothetical protein
MSGQRRGIVCDQLPGANGLRTLGDMHVSPASELTRSAEGVLPERRSRLVQPGEIVVALPDEYEQLVAENTVPSRPSTPDEAASTQRSRCLLSSFPWLGGPP